MDKYANVELERGLEYPARNNMMRITPSIQREPNVIPNREPVEKLDGLFRNAVMLHHVHVMLM